MILEADNDGKPFRFSESGARLLDKAQDEALRLNSPLVDIPHFLKAIPEIPGDPTYTTLQRLCVDLEEITQLDLILQNPTGVCRKLRRVDLFASEGTTSALRESVLYVHSISADPQIPLDSYAILVGLTRAEASTDLLSSLGLNRSVMDRDILRSLINRTPRLATQILGHMHKGKYSPQSLEVHVS